jgi:hypothetical protein
VAYTPWVILIAYSNLFPGGVPTTDQQTDLLDLNTEVGDGFGGEDPNENAFGLRSCQVRFSKRFIQEKVDRSL